MDVSKKLMVLDLIFRDKDVLFGKSNGNQIITSEMKIRKWMEITHKLQNLGIYNKDWKYLRDTTWQNWRKRTVEKCITKPGRKKSKYDQSDKIILDIIKKDTVSNKSDESQNSSGGSKKIKCEESGEETESMTKGDCSHLDNYNVSNSSVIQEPLESEIIVPVEYPRKSFSGTDFESNKSSKKTSNKLISLRIEKLEAEVQLAKEKVEIAKREKYKLDLELIKLEKELNIQKGSSFTSPYYQQNGGKIGGSNWQVHSPSPR